MNLLGKIFVVLNFVLALVFMSFAVCVYGVNRNWRAAIEGGKDDAKNPGYRKLLQTAYDEKAKKELYESVRATYEHQTDPRYAAARLWVDAIIDPAHTRDALITALEAAALNPEIREFKTGVLQT